jgi:hypothetical protein
MAHFLGMDIRDPHGSVGQLAIALHKVLVHMALDCGRHSGGGGLFDRFEEVLAMPILRRDLQDYRPPGFPGPSWY